MLLDFLFFADGPAVVGEGGLDKTLGLDTVDVRCEVPVWIGGDWKALALRFKAWMSEVDCD